MEPIRKCPSCGSSKIKGTVSIENGRYIQKIKCFGKNCNYENKKDIGDASNGQSY